MKLHSKVSEVTNFELRTLLREIREICETDAPRLANRTKIMDELCNIGLSEATDFGYLYSNIKRTVEGEILYRIQTGKM